MRKFLTIFTLSLLAVSCIDNDYDLSDIDTDDIGIGDENSVFTCPLMTLRVAVADIVNEQGNLDGILAEADVWLPNRLPDGAEAVDVKRLTGGDGQQAQQAYVQTLLTALQEEIDADASDRKLEQIARQIYAEYREDFLPDYLPVDVDEAEYIAAFRTVYHQQATHDLIWENIELFAARYLTTNLRIDVRPFVLSGIDVGADVRDMIVGGDESKTSLSLFGDIATDLPVSFSAEPSFEAEVEGSDRTLFSFPSFTVFPTAEVPVTNIYRDVILDEKQLPIKNCAYTQCFRREAGSYGKDVRGLNRLHEFSKVELVRIDKPEHSKQSHQEMLNHVEGLLQKLELPYRILRLCGGDMSFTAALCFDFEVYSEAQQRWLEVSSVSNFDTYQANRLKCRYRDENKKTQLCHTLNGSALALPRIVAALLENNQTPEGIRIPKALIPYTGFDMIK